MICAFVGLQYKCNFFNINFPSYAKIFFLLLLFIYHEKQLSMNLIHSFTQNVIIFKDMLLNVCLFYHVVSYQRLESSFLIS